MSPAASARRLEKDSMMVLSVGVLAEQAAGERRVALDPGATASLVHAGRAVRVESGAGVAAGFPDALYAAAGAVVGSRSATVDGCDVVASVGAPNESLAAQLRPDQLLIGLLDPMNNPPTVAALVERGVTLVAFEMLPRTLSRAQGMDALSSQASAAGYRAAIVAAAAFGRYLPMMITASGTAAPAKVIVIGAGVAGLQAIATTRRLGAVVTGYDVREASRAEVESLGALFLSPTVSDGSGAGGYARAMSEQEQASQQKELAASLASFDVIITTAKVPGHRPPLLVSAETLAQLRPGSVCVDLGSSPLGGNVAGSIDGTTIVTPGGVSVVGAGDLAADLPASASQMYGRNVVAVLASLAPAGAVVIDPSDEVHRNIVIGHGGTVTNEAIRKALNIEPLAVLEVPVAVPAP